MMPSLVIYANSQGEELLNTARYVPCFAGLLDFKWIPLHRVSAQDWDTRYGRGFMSNVVTVWEQVETGDASPDRQTLHARIPAGCRIVKFPALSATCLWPFGSSDPRAAADPDRYPWPDSIAATLATEQLPDDELFEKYLCLTTQKMPDLQRRLRLDIARWKASDEIADVALADWVENTFRNTNLFHTSGHITATAVSHLMKQLIARTSLFSPILARAAVEQVDVLLRHHTGQDIESVPIHPLVAERLDLRFYRSDATYRWHANAWTFRQYMIRYIRWADYLR